MANRKISDLTALTAPATGDLLPIVDISEAAAADKNKKITYGELLASAPAGSAAAPSFSFDSDPNTGIYSPGADQVAISTNGVARLTSSTTALTSALAVDVPLGAAATPSLTFTGDLNTGIYSPGADQVAISTGGTGRLFIDAAGLVGIGTSSPSNILHVSGTSGTPALFERTGSNGVFIGLKDGSVNNVFLGNTNGVFSVQTPGSSFSDKLVVTSAGLVGIGTTIPLEKLEIQDGSISVGSSANTSQANTLIAGYGYILSGTKYGNTSIRSTYNNANNLSSLEFYTSSSATASTERARIDSSGRLLVGTSSARSNVNLEAGDRTPHVQIETSTNSYNNGISIINNSADGYAPQLTLGLSLANGIGSNGNVAPVNPAAIGMINFVGNDGDQFLTGARVEGVADGVTGNGDMPTRLVFSTTADGAASPTERMRITSSGSVQSTNWTFSPSAINSRAVYFATDPNWGGAGGGGLVAINTSNGVVLGVSATSWASYSDIRMKTDLVPIENGLTKVSTLRAVTGRYNTDDANTSRSFLIAQDVEKVLPEAVESGNPDALGLRYTEVIPLLVAALKESKERIEQLETEMAAVKAQLS